MTPARPSWLALRVTVGVAVILAGIAYQAWQRHRAGGRCRSGAACADAATALLCKDGRWTEAPCRGPRGCRETDQLYCDYSANRDGDRCFGSGEDEGQCASDGKSLVVCTVVYGIKHVACRGSAGCIQDGQVARCDESVAREGDRCWAQGSACSEDGQLELDCLADKRVAVQSCRGAGACRAERGALRCDSSLARAGDPCRDEGTGACRDDKGAVLVCAKGPGGLAYVAPRPCAGGQTCGYDGHEFRCR